MASTDAEVKTVLMLQALQMAKKKRKKEQTLKIHGSLNDVIKAAVSGNPKGKKKS